MALQFRAKGSTDPMYNPARDFAYSHTIMVRCVIEAFNTGRWPEVFDTLCAAVPMASTDTATAHEDKCWAALLEAKDAYCNFINICCEDPEESYEDVIARSGWDDVGGPYKFAWLSMLGVVMTGQLFVGLRDTTAYETPRSTDVEELMKNSHKSRVVHNFDSPAGDLKQDLKSVIEALRDEDVNWEVIDRIVSREKGKE